MTYLPVVFLNLFSWFRLYILSFSLSEHITIVFLYNWHIITLGKFSSFTSFYTNRFYLRKQCVYARLINNENKTSMLVTATYFHLLAFLINLFLIISGNRKLFLAAIFSRGAGNMYFLLCFCFAHNYLLVM